MISPRDELQSNSKRAHLTRGLFHARAHGENGDFGCCVREREGLRLSWLTHYKVIKMTSAIQTHSIGFDYLPFEPGLEKKLGANFWNKIWASGWSKAVPKLSLGLRVVKGRGQALVGTATLAYNSTLPLICPFPLTAAPHVFIFYHTIKWPENGIATRY